MIIGAIILFLIVGIVTVIASLAGSAQSILGVYAFLAPWIHSIWFVLCVLICIYAFFLQIGTLKKILNVLRLVGVIFIGIVYRQLTIIFRGLCDNVLSKTTYYADLVHNIPVLADSLWIGIIFFFIFLIMLTIISCLATVGVDLDDEKK